LSRINPLNTLFSFALFLASASATPVHLRCEYRENPLGIDAPTPHLSWQNAGRERNWKQAAYEVLVATNNDRLQPAQADVWDSGRVESDDSVGIAYQGPALESRKRYYWKVRVWDTAGHVEESTENAWWEMGLLRTEDWKAKWISWKNPEDGADRAEIRWIWVHDGNPLETAPKTTVNFRAEVKLSQKPRWADLFIAVHGAYKARVNGHEVGNKSRWDAFDRREISSELTVGKNLIEVEVTTPPAPRYGPNTDAKTTASGFAALIKIRNQDGSIIRFTTARGWKAGVVNETQWHAAEVAGNLSDTRFGDPGPLPQPAAYLRRSVTISKNVLRARLYVTALGSYRMFLNGSRVGADVLTPGFTDFRKRILYQTYEVTNQLVPGTNVIAALLGDGWYGSPLTWAGAYFFAPPDRLFAQLELDYADGSHGTIVTDNAWKAAASPIFESQIYSGEVYDARLEQNGWNKPDFNDSGWQPAAVADTPNIPLTSEPDSPTQVIATLQPKSVTPSKNGAYIFDMGQNMVGWARLKVKGVAGTEVKLRYAEILSPDGTIYTENLRNADATDTYILRGDEEETFAPHFTFHGFRYVEVTGYPGAPPLDSIQGEVVSSVSENPSARLVTSSELVNHMWEIGLWGQRGNFLSVPTDCPQRDERLGWMGDAGVFWRTGTYNFDVAAFSQKFIQDIVDAQSSEGAFTNVSPNTMPEGRGGVQQPTQWSDVGAPGWGDAGVIIPWTTWLQYGDKAAIEKNWDAMQRWMEFIESRNPDFIRKNGVGPNFADWLAPDQNTNKDLLATAYWALIAHMMSQMAHAIGRQADAGRYDDVVRNIRTAFQKVYIKEDGTVGTGTQTSYVVALYTKMAPENLETALMEKLVKDIEAHNWHLTTGFLGTPFLLFTLADHGRSDVAYRLLLNDTYPSWGYMLSKGATTWWERWNGDTGDPAMNSYNHYAFGSVIAWVYRYAAGIDASTTAPGFKEIIIHPHPDPLMPSARAEYDSVYGTIVSDWKRTPDGTFTLRITIPANTSAKVILSALSGAHVTEDGNPIDAQLEDGSYVVRVGSGTYVLQVGH
jgi:alpha-L-rhamnosidase